MNEPWHHGLILVVALGQRIASPWFTSARHCAETLFHVVCLVPPTNCFSKEREKSSGTRMQWLAPGIPDLITPMTGLKIFARLDVHGQFQFWHWARKGKQQAFKEREREQERDWVYPSPIFFMKYTIPGIHTLTPMIRLSFIIQCRGWHLGFQFFCSLAKNAWVEHAPSTVTHHRSLMGTIDKLRQPAEPSRMGKWSVAWRDVSFLKYVCIYVSILRYTQHVDFKDQDTKTSCTDIFDGFLAYFAKDTGRRRKGSSYFLNPRPVQWFLCTGCEIWVHLDQGFCWLIFVRGAPRKVWWIFSLI